VPRLCSELLRYSSTALYLPTLLVPAATLRTSTVAASIEYHLLLPATTSGYSCFNPQLAVTYKQLHLFQGSGSLESKYKIAEKIILNRARAIPPAEAPSVNRKEIAFSSRSSLVSETTDQLPFMFLNETSKSSTKFNATGRSLQVKFNSPGEEQEPTSYLEECITAMTNYLVDKVPGRDLVGLRIRNT